MKILGIETSCDETAAAIVENGTKVLSSVITSSSDLHIKTGGIIPEVAAREQIKSIIPVIDQALLQAFPNSSNVKHKSLIIKNIDAIAVTYGPGLIGSLLVGIETAKTLSLISHIPLIPVNHLHGHIYAAWLNNKLPKFPAITLIVSGGHTDLVYIKNHGEIKWLGGTRDDAAGEAFDKTARLLNLNYPGGPAISQAAEKHLRSPLTARRPLTLFPRPMIDSDDYDFSFSGLKTAVYNYLKSTPPTNNNKAVSFLAANIQEAIVDTLITKSIKAIKEYKVNDFILSGGVAANHRLRAKFTEKLPKKVNFHAPDIKFCTDNAAMIAAAAFYNPNFTDPLKLNANPNLTITN